MVTETAEESIPIADARGNLDALITRARETKRPIIVTQDGGAAVVILDAEQYWKEREERDLFRGILEGEDAVRAGKVLSMEEVEAHLDAILAEEQE